MKEKQTIQDIIYDVRTKYHSLTNKKEINLTIREERCQEFLIEDMDIEHDSLSQFLYTHEVEEFTENVIGNDYVSLEVHVRL